MTIGVVVVRMVDELVVDDRIEVVVPVCWRHWEYPSSLLVTYASLSAAISYKHY